MKTPLLVATAITVASCSSPLPTLQTGPDPADVTAPAGNSRYTPVTAGTIDYRPVEPKSWRDLNERVAPRRTP